MGDSIQEHAMQAGFRIGSFELGLTNFEFKDDIQKAIQINVFIGVTQGEVPSSWWCTRQR
jgi:phage gp46-like protein